MKISVSLLILFVTVFASAQNKSFELGLKQLQNQEFEKAGVSFKEAIKVEPANSSYYFYLGYSLENLKKVDEARGAYQKAIELNPDYFDAQYNLGALFYKQGLTLIEKSNETDDFKLAIDLMKQGKKEFGNALPFMKSAYKLKPKDYGVLSALKLLYAQLEDEENYQKIGLELDALKNGK